MSDTLLDSRLFSVPLALLRERVGVRVLLVLNRELANEEGSEDPHPGPLPKKGEGARLREEARHV